MHPREFLWAAEAQEKKRRAMQGKPGGLTEEEAIEMADELKRARVAAGYPPE